MGVPSYTPQSTFGLDVSTKWFLLVSPESAALHQTEEVLFVDVAVNGRDPVVFDGWGWLYWKFHNTKDLEGAMCFKKRSYLWSWCDLMAKLVPPNCTVQRLIHSSEKQSCLAMTNCSTGNSHLRPKMKTEIMVTPTVPVGAPDHRDGLHLHFTFLEDKHHICNYLQPALWYFTSFLSL